jgi:tetratricopeptide (TPR) repeat protein
VKIEVLIARICRATLTALVAAAMSMALAAQQPASQSAQPQTPEQAKAATIQITTASPQARAFFEQGLAKMETLHWEAALSKWREAAQADPNFALAHAFLADLSRDHIEQVAERDKAIATRKFAGAEEQLVIDWIVNSSQSHWVPAIQAMNEALADYPQDKYVARLAGLWLTNQRQTERAIPLFERANQLDPKFADPLNQAAYCYARLGDFEKAFADMQRYAELLPNEANPQDSFAEISRLAGRFNDSLEHYRASLKIDPSFIDSQAGLGDTYAVMGEEEKARAEYDIAIARATTRVESVSYSLQHAATWAREQNFAKADAEYQQLAQAAHEHGLGNLEAEAWRRTSVYQADNRKAMQMLGKAEDALKHPHQMSAAAREQELALILRTRVGHSVHNGNMKDALASLKKLQVLAGENNSGPVQYALNGAQGAVLMAQGKFDDAIAHLQEDDKNPFSLQRLIVAYKKVGAIDRATAMSARLAKYYEPTIEQAVVVPAFNKSLVAMTDKN